MPVVDASVVIDWVAPGVSATAPAVKFFDRLARASLEIAGPRLLLEEVSNALLSGVRRRRWSGAAADASHVLLLSLPVRLAADHRDLDRAWELARRYDNHPIYDMIYVALAERTVEWHIEQMLGKLGLTNRVQVASWVAQRSSRSPA